MEKLYDVTLAAEKLGGVSVSTVRAWLTAGKLARTKIGRRTMISERELDRFIEQGQATNRHESENGTALERR